MKKNFIIALLLIVLLIFASCGKKEGDDKETTIEGNDQTQVIWDAETYNTHDEFVKALGIEMSAPNEATGDTYIIIADSLGEILYECDELSWTFRASKSHSGYELYGIDEINFTGESSSVDVNGASYGIIRTNDGGALAFWSIGGVNYSLFTENTVSDEQMRSQILGLGY